MLLQWALCSVALASTAVTAQSSDVRVMHRALNRRQPKNAADLAKVHGPDQCKDYGDDTLYKMMKEHKFPKDGDIASIVDNDKEANDVWNEIKNSGIIPKHVAVKEGTDDNMGISDKQNDNYDKKDPDCWWSATKCNKPKAKNIPEDLYECPEPKTWGLTFDDGPNCSHNEFYDFMQKNKLRATLFYIGSNIVNNPYQAQRGIADGHDVCVHTWSHHYMTTLSNEQVFAELYYTGKIIKTVLGVTPRCWRPPFGDTDDRVRAIAAGLGLRTIVWKEDTDDWSVDSGTPKSQIKKNYEGIIKKADKESPVVLAHELTNNTMSLFVEEYGNIKKAFDNIVPMTACFNVSRPYPEDIEYPDFAAFTSGTLDPKGKPDISKVKVDSSASFKAVPLSKQTQKGSYVSPGSGKSKDDQGKDDKSGSGSGGSGSGGSGSSDSGNSPNSENKSADSDGQGSATTASKLLALVGGALVTITIFFTL